MRRVPRHLQILPALDNEWCSSDELVDQTGISRKMAVKYAERLVSEGLAEKGGSRMFPRWRRAPMSNHEEVETAIREIARFTEAAERGEVDDAPFSAIETVVIAYGRLYLALSSRPEPLTSTSREEPDGPT